MVCMRMSRAAAGGLVGGQGHGELRIHDGEHRAAQIAAVPPLDPAVSLVITDESLISLPAAAMVSTAPIGRAARACRFPQ